MNTDRYYKRCTKCGLLKGRTAFEKRVYPNGRETLHSWCRPCRREDVKRWKREHPERTQAMNRKAYEKYMADPKHRQRKVDRNREYMAKRRQEDPLFRMREAENVRIAYRLKAEREGRVVEARKTKSPFTGVRVNTVMLNQFVERVAS